MIGTIRKHSKWLWWFIAGLTIISFIYWGAGPSNTGGGGGRPGDFGTMYGRKITQQDYIEARNEYYIFFRLQYGEWPDKNPNLRRNDLERDIYIHLMFDRKAADLGIHVGDEAAQQAAAELLRSFGQRGQPVPMDAFVKQFLQPAGLNADDFKRYVRHYLIIQQLTQALGAPGELVTPQQAAADYEREYREYSAQAVFFSASNYLSTVTVTPSAVAQYYTNYLAAYRLPDRVQVCYVEFNESNYLAQAKAEWAKTNFEEVVKENYRRLGPDYFADAKTPEAAKAKIRDEIIRQTALGKANQAANDFANTLFVIEPAKVENLATVAKQKDLKVNLTAPFASSYGPTEFEAPPAFTATAFKLTPDEPLAGPVGGPNAAYVLGLVKQLPSEIPSFDQIRARVTADCRMHEATLLAQRAGTNFVHTLTNQMAAGHTFAAASVAAGLHPEALPPFSLSTRELPELRERADLNLLKQAAFGTPVGQTSGFVETGDGGFVLHVESRLPVDQAAMRRQMPQFMAELRRARQNLAFNEWLQLEANRQLRNTPVFSQTPTPGAR